MLRTNSKIVVEQVKNYIKTSIEETLKNYEFESDFISQLNDNLYYEEIENLKEFVIYLINVVGVFTPYYSEQRELLKEWLKETEEESKQYNDERVNSLFSNLISMYIRNTLNIEILFIKGKYNQDTLKVMIK